MQKSILSLLVTVATTVLAIAMFTACAEQELSIEPAPVDPQKTSVLDITKPAVGAEKMENPYTLENMRDAFNNLATQTRSGLDVDDVVVNTHSHVRIVFRTDEEYYVAQSLGLDMFYSPLDVVFEKGGYIENEGNMDGTDVRYCVVSAAQLDAIKESGAEYMVLAEMFMPDEEEGYQTRGITTRSGTTLTPEFIDRLVESAYALKGYEDYLPEESEPAGAPATRGIYPWGRITYMDVPLVNGYPSTTPKTIGMEGMEVKATRLFKTAHGYTDAGGYYTCDKSFKNPWKYETSFERWEFAIRNGYSGAKSFGTGKTESWWDMYFTTLHDDNHFQATIFRAAHHYYYQDIQGLRRPPENGTFKVQMKIAALYQENDEANGVIRMGWRRFLGIGNPIYIYNPKHNPHEIYSTTIHELAHAAHWKMSKSDYNQENEEMYRLRNTWARGVQYSLVRMKYPTYQGADIVMPRYTNLVKDLIDTEAEYADWIDYNITKGDNVQEYTIKQIEDCMIGTRTWAQFRQKIYDKAPTNSTRNNLQTLFNSWDN